MATGIRQEILEGCVPPVRLYQVTLGEKNLNTEHAHCHCGNISAEVIIPGDLSAYTPRACDCNFCIMNGAAYISDPKGELRIEIADPAETNLYKQGHNLVELLICKNCGVLFSVTYSDSSTIIGGLNSKTLVNRDQLAPVQVASPKLLSPSDKITRWREIWFPRVSINQK